ncbi:MAG: cytochrome c oxidase subunit I [Candidatus Pelagibacter sp.]|jgi:cytochrome c oxidase subunit 1|nr:cytochrome c oxidase subunit I [Candidatus Pelagibacter sp.]
MPEGDGYDYKIEAKAYTASSSGASVSPAESPDQELYHSKSWWTTYVFSQDAKYIGIQYFCAATAIAVLGLVLSVLMRVQLAYPGLNVLDPSTYYQAITMHGMIMVIFFLTALFLGGFGNFLIPLMCGARDMVFPYVNMMSFWIFLLSLLVLVASYLVPGGPTGAGWTLYPPQVITAGTPGNLWGLVLMLVSIVLFVVGFTMGGLNYVITVLQARTRGMTLMRMPLSVWGIFVATIIALLAFPALLVGGLMLLLDTVLGTSFYMPAIIATSNFGNEVSTEGGSPLLFQHLFWFFGHPEVYIVALPAFGIVSDLISVHARRNIFGYRMMVWAIIAIAALSFIVWAHHMYIAGFTPWFGFFFASTTLMIAIPTGIKMYNWLLTLWRGNIRFTVPMLFALAFFITFLNGGLTGMFMGNVGTDIALSDTYFVVAHFHFTIGIAPVLVVFGAVYHWFPLATGRMLDEGLGKIHFWITFVGAYMIYFPMHYQGLQGVPRRYFEMYNSSQASSSGLNEFITIVTIVVALSQLIFFYNIINSARAGKKAKKNPWDANSLEWQTPEMPPKHGNWGRTLPVVYRWPYDFNVPGASKDYIPQNVSPSQVRGAKAERT